MIVLWSGLLNLSFFVYMFIVSHADSMGAKDLSEDMQLQQQ